MKDQIKEWTKTRAEKLAKVLDIYIEEIVRSDKVKPPIKGKITFGKLKWRGLQIYCTELNMNNYDSFLDYVKNAYYIKQRGVLIDTNN